MSDERRICETCKDLELDEEEGRCISCKALVEQDEVVMSNWRPKNKKPESESTEQRLCGDCADYDLPASSSPCCKCHGTQEKPNWRMKEDLIGQLRNAIRTRTAERDNWRERWKVSDNQLMAEKMNLAWADKEVLRLTEERDEWRVKYADSTKVGRENPEFKRLEESYRAMKKALDQAATERDLLLNLRKQVIEILHISDTRSAELFEGLERLLGVEEKK